MAACRTVRPFCDRDSAPVYGQRDRFHILAIISILSRLQLDGRQVAPP